VDFSRWALALSSRRCLLVSASGTGSTSDQTLST
jgi:hypothetical protein